MDSTKDCIEVVALMQGFDDDYEDDECEVKLSMCDWEKELCEEYCRLHDIVYSWDKMVKLNAPSVWESYKWMDNFIDDVVDRNDAKAIQQLSQALGGGRGVFRRFKDAAHRTGYIDKWYEYSAKRQTEYLANMLEDSGFHVVDEGGKPLNCLNEVCLF